MKEIFSSGGGTQSTYIAVLILQGRLPRPDVSVIIDTERERSAVWEYFERWTKPAFEKAGMEFHRVKKSQFTDIDLWSGKDGNTLEIPAFTNQTGEIGKLPNFCSHEWKTRVMNRFVRSLGIPTKLQKRWIGFSTNEKRRVNRILLGEEFKKGRIRLPLVHDIPTTREEAIQGVLDFGWPMPPRSACWMCANQQDEEWIDLKDNWPADFEEACKLDESMRERDPFAFLHSSCVPLREVKFETRPDDERQCGSGGCFV